ncbi:MAG TPA: N-acetyltransferase [archaeon]|nr:N-acetyltransferase [archaeon]
MERENGTEGVNAVIHDELSQKFYIKLYKDEAVLAYTQINDMIDVHTLVVPEGMENLEEALIEAAFDYAAKNKIKIIPTEKKIKEYAENHPETRNLIVEL